MVEEGEKVVLVRDDLRTKQASVRQQVRALTRFERPSSLRPHPHASKNPLLRRLLRRP